jgi:hypothetical protein
MSEFIKLSFRPLKIAFMFWLLLNLLGELIVSKGGLAYDSSGPSFIIWWLIKIFTFPVWIGREFLNSFFEIPEDYETFFAHAIAIALVCLIFLILNRLLSRKI